MILGFSVSSTFHYPGKSVGKQTMTTNFGPDMEPGSLKPVQNIQLPPELGRRGKGKDRERDWGSGDPFIPANCPPCGGWRIPCVGPHGHSFPSPPFPPDPINIFLHAGWAKMPQIGQNPFWRAQGSILARTWRDNALWPGYSHPCQSLASILEEFCQTSSIFRQKEARQM